MVSNCTLSSGEFWYLHLHMKFGLLTIKAYTRSTAQHKIKNCRMVTKINQNQTWGGILSVNSLEELAADNNDIDMSGNSSHGVLS